MDNGHVNINSMRKFPVLKTPPSPLTILIFNHFIITEKPTNNTPYNNVPYSQYVIRQGSNCM